MNILKIGESKVKQVSLIIAGDLVPTKSNAGLFAAADIGTLLGDELLAIWNSADIRIINLETPLIDNDYPIDKCGPNLIASTNTVKGLKALNPSLISLANNHILDQGIQGLESTKDVLTAYNIPFNGVGNNLNEASKPYIIEHSGLRIGVYACAEHEFTIATQKTPGANPFDPLESLDHIRQLKASCDYVIVLYHGGKEHYRYPSPYLQKVCRKMVDKGADLVVCQHSHCVGAFEDYYPGTIIYGQGNFIFDKSESEFWQTSLLLNVKLRNNRMFVEYIPIFKYENGIRLASERQAKQIMDDFNKRSQQILDDGYTEKKYKQFALENINNYLRSFSGMGKWMSRIDRHLLNGALIKKKYNKRKLLVIKNFIECEAHRELILAGLIDKDKLC